MVDEYQTIVGTSQGTYSELRSKFLGFAHHVTTPEEALSLVAEYQKKYYDARHVCWAYMLGAEREQFRSNDNGEPSGTAGKPILGQINSRELTDVIVLVVRYFGGVKLGTSGLIEAYRTTAAATLDDAQVETRGSRHQLPLSGRNVLLEIRVGRLTCHCRHMHHQSGKAMTEVLHC